MRIGRDCDRSVGGALISDFSSEPGGPQNHNSKSHPPAQPAPHPPLNDAPIIPAEISSHTILSAPSSALYPAIMLPRAARSPCGRIPARFVRRGPVAPRSSPWLPTAYSAQLRAFSATHKGPLLKQAADEPPVERKQTNPASTPSAIPSPDAAVAQNAKDAPKASVPDKKKKDLLGESTVATKEQRKADWAIMKEMAKYLWPKVGAHGNDVGDNDLVVNGGPCRMTGVRNFVSEVHCHCWLALR